MSGLFTSRIIKPNIKSVTKSVMRPKRSRAQATFEYLVVLGIVMSLLLPGVYLFYNKSQSTSDTIAIQRLAQMGADLVSAAEYIYPFGSGSKTTLTFNVPVGVRNITVRGQGNPTGNEFVINLNVSGQNHSLVYFSKYPIFIGNCTNSSMALPAEFVNNPGRKDFQIISCGANVSIYKKQ